MLFIAVIIHRLKSTVDNRDCSAKQAHTALSYLSSRLRTVCITPCMVCQQRDRGQNVVIFNTAYLVASSNRLLPANVTRQKSIKSVYLYSTMARVPLQLKSSAQFQLLLCVDRNVVGIILFRARNPVERRSVYVGR